jgi:sugar phosphate isomerase/epimerase
MRISFLFYEPIADFAELERRLALLAALGYHGVELSACHPPPYSAADVAAAAQRHGLVVASFLSGWSYSAEGLCLCRPDAAARGRAVARLCDYVAYVAPLGAVLVIGLMQGLRVDEPDEPAAQPRIVEGLRSVARAAEAAGVTLVLEPVNHLQVGFHHTADEVAALVARVGSPELGYMLDTIHMNIEEQSVLETIRRHGGRIRHFHLCETNGGPFGTGGLPFPVVLAALTESGYRGWVSTKVYRKVGWEEAARSTAAFLRKCGVALRGDAS